MRRAALVRTTVVASISLTMTSFGAVLLHSVFPLQDATDSQTLNHTIVFTQIQNGRSQIFTTDGNGPDVRQVTAEDANTTQASWSPDGTITSFADDTSDSLAGRSALYTIDTDGTGLRRITDGEVHETGPADDALDSRCRRNKPARDSNRPHRSDVRSSVLVTGRPDCYLRASRRPERVRWQGDTRSGRRER